MTAFQAILPAAVQQRASLSDAAVGRPACVHSSPAHQHLRSSDRGRCYALTSPEQGSLATATDGGSGGGRSSGGGSGSGRIGTGGGGNSGDDSTDPKADDELLSLSQVCFRAADPLLSHVKLLPLDSRRAVLVGCN